MFLYIDATAGGLIVQALLGGSAGLAVVARLFWGRLPWQRKRRQAEAAEGAEEASEHVER